MSEFPSQAELYSLHKTETFSISEAEGRILEIEVAVSVAYDPNFKNRERKIKELILELVQNGYAYLAAITNGQYRPPKTYSVEISPRRKHGNDGSFMKVSASQLIEFFIEEEGATERAPKLKELHQSLIIHELVHNARTEEDLSMAAEIIYLLEKGQQWRIENIKRLYEEGKLTKPYLDGLETIAKWFGSTSIPKMFSSLDESKIAVLKEKLKTGLKEEYKKFEDEIREAENN